MNSTRALWSGKLLAATRTLDKIDSKVVVGWLVKERFRQVIDIVHWACFRHWILTKLPPNSIPRYTLMILDVSLWPSRSVLRILIAWWIAHWVNNHSFHVLYLQEQWLSMRVWTFAKQSWTVVRTACSWFCTRWNMLQQNDHMSFETSEFWKICLVEGDLVAKVFESLLSSATVSSFLS